MSRQNKVNPGMYTQRGRLTQDDAARELKHQRNISAPHTWQHGHNDRLPSFKGSEPMARDEEVEPPKAKTVKAKARKETPVKTKAKSVRKTAPKAKTTAAKSKAGGTAKKAPARKPAGKAKKAAKRG